MKEQPIPDAAERDPAAMELARIWVAEHGLHCALRIGAYDETPIDEARAWGMMLADLLRHLGRGLSDYYRRDPVEVVDVLLEAIRDELATPSSPVEGGLVRTREDDQDLAHPKAH
ncbi:DUF5076 domain-containing protein [Caulobacter endophyticus]|uniref:DUF5076 domain-containing protein n=1 Tax=Caulobacter endophyticus TaxID=2172652 RepID=A0A2T9JFA9_9CAUL|nr:DUF5076 domain-containing protein [Caulobacter endophyticus]PVM82380.1 DUF5076 domain-containing protein [Caulobacter endophyticus]